jgi:hypothetical protein
MVVLIWFSVVVVQDFDGVAVEDGESEPKKSVDCQEENPLMSS